MAASTAVEPSGPSVTPAVASAVSLLAVAADPLRWRLLRLLEGGPTCVCELQQACAVPANLLSYHLRVLREAGLVAATRRGRWIDYALADDAGARLAAALPVPAHPRVEVGGRR